MTRALLCVGLACAMTPSFAASAGLEDALQARWRGSWVVVTGEVSSGCRGGYANNKVSGSLVSSRADHRFTAGELGRVAKVNVTRSRVDLYVDLNEPLLEGYQDGPFTLYRELRCGVQLMVEVPREVVKGNDVPSAEAALAHIVQRFAREDEARRSGAYNRRVRDPYPADYEVTLARHAAWQAEQVNAKVRDRQEEAGDDAAAVLARVRQDPDYLDGFAAGVAALRHWRAGGCPGALDRSFAVASSQAPRDRRDARRWREGFEDGQRLTFAVEMLRRLPDCYVPVPAAP